MVKNLPANTSDMSLGFDPWIRKIPRRRAWQPTPAFLPGQRSLAGYSPWVAELDTIEATAYITLPLLISFWAYFQNMSQIHSLFFTPMATTVL